MVGAQTLPAQQNAAIDFARDIQPLLAQKCFACHGPSKEKGGLRLDRRERALTKLDSGQAAIVPGVPEKSILLMRVTDADPSERMPPKGEPLSAKEIQRLRQWIAEGAPYREHWAFAAPKAGEPPTVNRPAWCRNPIDRYILARLETHGIEPSPEAESTTLLRRLHLDLTGLLPAPADIDSYLADRSPQAYERLVDRLLASPHFGERWGRHWLDLARYADSNGYERDDVRPNAWRYRDWVIQSLNADQPFDRFVVDQLAGDLLPAASLEQRIATGFHRMTTKNTESGINQEDYRNREVVDRVNTTGSAFLGLTVGCAQCHSHKYDPISQTEYYQLYAFFNNGQEKDVEVAGTPAEQAAYQSALAVHERREALLKRRQTIFDAIAKVGFERWRADLRTANGTSAGQLASNGTKGVSGTSPAPSLDDQLAELDEPRDLHEAIRLDKEKRGPNQQALVVEFERALAAKRDDLVKEIRQLGVEKRYLPKPAAMTITEAATSRRATHVLLHGDFKQKGTSVQPGTPQVLPPIHARGAAVDRLDLARWLVDPRHPLTARVAVNRVWKQLFGRGLVATVDDFGTQGERPSHPELLDWLAQEFQTDWSRKRLIRLIVTSAAYRQASKERPELQKVDPLNTLLARQNRLRVEGEVVRDLFLTASGLLCRKVGGGLIQPPAPDSIRDLGYKYKLVWQESAAPDRYRRGLYIQLKRSNPYPSLTVFDCPEGTVCMAARNRSNTPLQALTTLNDANFVECAQALGRRVIVEGPAPVEERLQFIAKIGLGRALRRVELETLRELYDEERQTYQSDAKAAAELTGPYRTPGHADAETAAWVAVARAVLNLDEFIVKP